MLIMREKIIKNISTYNLIERGDSILIGFSGGMDSTSLLYSLLEIRDDFDLTISICHLNHGVRGEEANRDEEFSRNTAKKLGIYFKSEKTDMHGLAHKEKISKEAAGRKLRQDFFKRVSEEIGANKIALAHNYNDQVETLLMRIIRGTGLDGLKGIEYKSGAIIRPLLNITRKEIEEYIYKNNIQYVEDSTNLEIDYHRNKIRNVLLPLLREEYNPKIDTSIFNLSELAKLDGEFLEQYSKNIFREIAIKESNQISINIDQLNSLDKAIQNRIIRLAFDQFPKGLRDLSLENVEEIIQLKDLQSGKFIDNINEIRIRNSYGNFIFERNFNIHHNDIYISLKKGINNIHGEIILVEEVSEQINTKNSITIPKELIKTDLVIRTRKDGDKMRPLGLSGTKKLKDIFIDKKIDRLHRNKYLILADSENIYWIIDLLKSELTELKSKNDEYIKITKVNMED